MANFFSKFILNSLNDMENAITASFRGLDGSLLKGPVVFSGENGYLFRNTFSEDDLYFYLKKSQGEWYFAGGPETIKIPQEFIDAVGNQIDEKIK